MNKENGTVFVVLSVFTLVVLLVWFIMYVALGNNTEKTNTYKPAKPPITWKSTGKSIGKITGKFGQGFWSGIKESFNEESK